MMEFTDQQTLEVLNRLPFSGVNPRLLQETPQVQILSLKSKLLFRRHGTLLADRATTEMHVAALKFLAHERVTDAVVPYRTSDGGTWVAPTQAGAQASSRRSICRLSCSGW